MTPTQFAEAVAAEVRAELARQHKSTADLAVALGVTTRTASKRLKGEQDFDATDLGKIANWLGVAVETFVPHGHIEASA